MNESPADAERGEVSTSGMPSQTGGQRILLVDDEPSYRDSLGHILSHERYVVRTAAGSKDAIDAARDFVPDILIVDWMLRDGMDGVQVAQNLRSLNSRLKTIFITGYRTSRLEKQMSEVPFAQFLSKPFSLEDFLGAIRTAASEVESDVH